MRLVEAEVAMIERWDLLERVDREIVARAVRAHRDRRERPVGAFFFQRERDRADIGAAGNAVQREVGHRSSS